MDRQEWLNSLEEGSEVVVINNGQRAHKASVTHATPQGVFINGRKFSRKTGEATSKRCISRLEPVGSENAVDVATAAETKRAELSALLASMRGAS